MQWVEVVVSGLCEGAEDMKPNEPRQCATCKFYRPLDKGYACEPIDANGHKKLWLEFNYDPTRFFCLYWRRDDG